MARPDESRRRTRQAMWFTLAVFAVVIGGFVYRNEWAVRRFMFEQKRWIDYRTGDNRLYNDLSARRIKFGDDVEQLIVNHPPYKVIRHGQFVTLEYDPPGFGGLTVIARDGKLVYAAIWSCTYTDTFFGDESALGPEYGHSFSAEHHRLLAVRDDARRAVAGFGATFEPWNVPKSEP